MAAGGARRARARRPPAPDWLKLTLMMAAGVLASGGGDGARAQEMVSCCAKAEGSCRSVCEKMSLAEIAADGAMREDRIRNVYKFCSPALIDFWICMNETIQEVMAGDEWWGRACCALPRGAECRRACATGRDARAAAAACRRSDELAFFDCVQRQRDAQHCCSQTQSVSCHEACRDLFWRALRGAGAASAARSRATELCEQSPAVTQCMHNLTRTPAATDPLKYMSCCQQSRSGSCRDTCRRVLRSSVNSQEIIDALVGGGCGAPLPHDAFWQCFLRKDSQADTADLAAVDRLGVDSAKLHCCQKGASAACRRLCFGTYNRDWLDNWLPFESDCLKSPRELRLAQCVLEVDEPCSLGCDGLTYCTNFNDRPTQLFRACTSAADVTAHQDLNAQLSRGYLALDGLQLPVHNSSRCSPELWKAVACVLQIKPCTHEGHSSRLCREDCYRLLSECVQWDAARAQREDVTAASLCDLTSPAAPELPCLSLHHYLAPSTEVSTRGRPLNERVTSPCAGAPCNATQVCAVNRACERGASCARFTCLPGCPVGEASEFAVPVGTYVRVPTGSASKGCVKICSCGARGALERCRPLPCFTYDNCSLGDEIIPHGATYYIECNECKCYAGERVCSRRACADAESGAGATALLTRLPCNCPAHYLPVCVAGRTLASACLAKCSGYADADVESGTCAERERARDVCRDAACPPQHACAPRPTVCLSLMQAPCPQYACVRRSDCGADGAAAAEGTEEACDTEGRTHRSACELLARGRLLAYYGPCLDGCARESEGPVCGADGATYASECAARARRASVDYAGACVAVGPITDAMRARCSLERVSCPRLARARCQGFTAPGACCPRCGGALRILYSRKQVDRALYAMREVRGAGLELRDALAALQRHVGVAECALRGHLTVETEIFVSVESAVREPSELQLRACVLEAERLAALVNGESARLAAELSLSALTYAIPVHTFYSAPSAARALSALLCPLALCALASLLPAAGAASAGR